MSPQTAEPASTGAAGPKVEVIVARAKELSQGTADGAVGAVIAEFGGDPAALEAARDALAARLHAATDDFEATAALQLLNRVLSRMPRIDPLDWRVRWHQRFRRP